MNKKQPGQYKAHVFVCTNDKKGECCGAKGAEKLRKELKDWAKTNPDWKKKIRINGSACLDRCSEGIAIAIYPQNEWLLEVERDDLEAVKAEIERLMSAN